MYEIRLGEILFPITPGKLSWEYNGDNKTTALIDVGEINILRPQKLKEISFDAVFPSVKYPFAVYENNVFLPPSYYLDYFKKTLEERNVLYFSIYRSMPRGEYLYGDSFPVTIESLSVEEDAEEGFDVTVSFQLKQYKEYATYKATLVGGDLMEALERPISEEKEEEIPSETNPKEYTVKSGDTLWAICKSVYGDPNKYHQVAEANGIANPNRIYPGQVIILA